MQISLEMWTKYVSKLALINGKAARLMVSYLAKNPRASVEQIIAYAHSLTTKYGEAAAALACEMYDTIAVASGVIVPEAIPAETATLSEVAYSVTRNTGNDMGIARNVERLVKMAAADTTMQNAIRDRAEWAWIPSGDSCAFCITLGSNGWQTASKDQMNGKHARHIHANCDCNFAVRFGKKGDVEGYDPDALYEKYQSASDGNSKEKINALRRRNYAENREAINRQKREAYAARKEREKNQT